MFRGQARRSKSPQVWTEAVRGKRSDLNGIAISTSNPSAVMRPFEDQIASHEKSSPCCVVAIRTPSLSERMDDLPLIVAHLLEKHAVRLRRPTPRFSGDAMALLSHYSWPGHVRELENLIERTLAVVAEAEIGPAVLPPRLAAGSGPRPLLGEAGPALAAASPPDALAWVD